jgi:hypothetical protein
MIGDVKVCATRPQYGEPRMFSRSERPWGAFFLLGAIPLFTFLGSTTAHAQTPTSADLQTLRQIGAQVAHAMITKDPKVLLKYDMESLHVEHERELRDPNSDLYCYLFDTTCPSLHEKSNRSVYSQLLNMKSIAVEVKSLATKPADPPSYLLIFYDKLKHQPQQVLRNSFLCKHAQVDVPIWTFNFQHGAWVAAHPLFNAEIDPWCSPE